MTPITHTTSHTTLQFVFNNKWSVSSTASLSQWNQWYRCGPHVQAKTTAQTWPCYIVASGTVVSHSFEVNGYFQLTQWSRGNASALGAKCPGFGFLDLARIFMFDFVFCCCCGFTFLSKNTLKHIICKILQFLFQCEFI